jgi:tocopherol cyclase
MRRYLHTVLTPAMYHGHRANPPFFEGWYFKLISADEGHRLAVIPGVILGEQGHAFIQVLNGSEGTVAYHRFPLEQFWASDRKFEVWIGESRFTSEAISLKVATEVGTLEGQLRFENPIPWPVSWLSPGIMGWYAWVPRMECYHGVLGFDHPILGALRIDGRALDFEAGRGYIEKDWGRSFPSAWVWLQSNHFESLGTSLTASVAEIPFLRGAFRGFIVGLWHERRLYRFATYTGAEIKGLDIQPDHVRFAITDKEYTLTLVARKAASGALLGPTRVQMGIRVNETLQAKVEACLETSNGEVLFEGVGRNAGLEVQGDLERLG